MAPWSQLFDEVTPEPPATAEDLRQLQDDLYRPLSESEIQEIIRNQINPWLETDPERATWQPRDPREWPMPSVPLPADYLDFLRWSNGGWIRVGERQFGFFSTSCVREYLLSYHFPANMPGAIPLGLDGGGIFAVLDIRKGPAENYPVLAVHASALDFSDSAFLAGTFSEFCAGREEIQEVLSPPNPAAEEWVKPVDVILTGNPKSLPLLMSLREHFELEMPAKQLLESARNPPQLLLTAVPQGWCRSIMEKLPPELAPFIEMKESKSARGPG